MKKFALTIVMALVLSGILGALLTPSLYNVGMFLTWIMILVSIVTVGVNIIGILFTSKFSDEQIQDTGSMNILVLIFIRSLSLGVIGAAVYTGAIFTAVVYSVVFVSSYFTSKILISELNKEQAARKEV